MRLIRWYRRRKAEKVHFLSLAGRSIPGVDEWLVMSDDDTGPLTVPYVTDLKVAMDPERFNPEDLTKGGGEFTFQDHFVDTGVEIGALPT